MGHRKGSRAKRDEATADHCVQSTTKSLVEQRELSSGIHKCEEKAVEQESQGAVKGYLKRERKLN
jgi:hypothetical protein